MENIEEINTSSSNNVDAFNTEKVKDKRYALIHYNNKRRRNIKETGTYSGGWKDGKPHGEGVFNIEKEEIDARFGLENGQLHGRTNWITAAIPDKKKIIATWDNGRPKQKEYADVTYTNGDRYKGQLTDDAERDGFGFSVCKNYGEYKGEWKNDEANGYGEIIYDNYLYKIGNGYRIMRYPDGTYYMGEWENDKREGFGEETTDYGETYYQGQFKKGERYIGVEKKGNEITIIKRWKLDNESGKDTNESILITDGTKVQRTIDSNIDDSYSSSYGYNSDSSEDNMPIGNTSNVTTFELSNDEKIEWNPETENYVKFIKRVEKIIKDKEEKRDNKKNNTITFSKEDDNKEKSGKNGKGGGGIFG